MKTIKRRLESKKTKKKIAQAISTPSSSSSPTTPISSEGLPLTILLATPIIDSLSTSIPQPVRSKAQAQRDLIKCMRYHKSTGDIDACIQDGADVHGESIVILAAAYGYNNIVDHLVTRHNADIHAFRGGWNAILWAVNENQCHTLDHLVTKYGLNPHTADKNGVTALHRAAFRGYNDIIERLVTHYGVDVHVQDGGGRTPAMYAQESGQDKAIAYLEILEAQYPAKTSISSLENNTIVHSGIRISKLAAAPTPALTSASQPTSTVPSSQTPLLCIDPDALSQTSVSDKQSSFFSYPSIYSVVHNSTLHQPKPEIIAPSKPVLNDILATPTPHVP